MYLAQLTEEKLSRILLGILSDVRHDENWFDSFPSVLGYDPFVPASIDEAIENPNALYSDDHAIASIAANYPRLITLLQQIVNAMIYTNIHWQRRDMCDGIEQPGVSFARVLAMQDVGYVKLYGDFFLSLQNNYREIHQPYDIIHIVRKWDWREETYYLLFTYWLFENPNKESVLTYLIENGFSLRNKLMDNSEYYLFLNVLKKFIEKAEYSYEEMTSRIFLLLERLIDNHIFFDNKEIAEARKNRYREILDRLFQPKLNKRLSIGTLPDKISIRKDLRRRI